LLTLERLPFLVSQMRCPHHTERGGEAAEEADAAGQDNREGKRA